MKTLLFALTMSAILSLPAPGQQLRPVDPSDIDFLRVVADPDGTSNLRVGPSLNSRVAGRVKSGAVVGIMEEKGDWALIMGDNPAGDDLYIHTSRLQKMTSWKQAKAKKQAQKLGVVEAAGTRVEVKAVPFDQTKHKIKKENELLMSIDGHHAWGTDGNFPSHSLTLAVTIGGTAVKVPASATEDLYEPNMESLSILTPGKPEEQMAIVMWNSDGAGGYMVAWSFVKGAYAGRAIFVP